MTTPAVADQPLLMLDLDSGAQLSLPVTALVFDDDGKLRVSGWEPYDTGKPALRTAVDAWLKRLRESGALQRAPKAAPRPAMLAVALTPGAKGVSVALEITKVDAKTPAGDSLVDATATETNRIEGLTPAKLAETIGTAAGGGTRPGLVFLSSPGTPDLPKAGSYPQGAPAAKIAIRKHAGSGNAFALEGRGDAAAAALTKVEIADVNAAADTFTLVVRWEKAVKAKKLSDLAAEFAQVVKLSAPDGGLRAPAVGKVQLAGGSDAVSLAARPAAAVILSPDA